MVMSPVFILNHVCLNANGRVPFLRVYRRSGNPPLGRIGNSTGVSIEKTFV